MARLQIDSVDFQDEAFQPLVAMIASKVDEAFNLHQARKELPRFMKKNQACIYLNCSFNTLQKYRTMGLRTIFLDNEEKIDQRDCDLFMEKHKK